MILERLNELYGKNVRGYIKYVKGRREDISELEGGMKGWD